MTHLYAVHIICARGGYLRNAKKKNTHQTENYPHSLEKNVLGRSKVKTGTALC